MLLRPSPLPDEYRRPIPSGPTYNLVNTTLAELNLNTICTSGRCPNRTECWARGSLAFMILGEICTRRCGFCAVKTARPGAVDEMEPERLAEAASRLALKHVVVTSVARDDLPDGGAHVFAAVTRALRSRVPEAVIELLTPDFQGDEAALEIVLAERPDIFNHNIETVERLTPRVRSRAAYRRSLAVLARAKETHPEILTKSGMMLGLGETPEEVDQTLQDLRAAGCDLLTIGQYLQPSPRHLEIIRFTPIEEFACWKGRAFALGFKSVASGPLVRSSYFADELATLTSILSPQGRGSSIIPLPWRERVG